VPLQPQENFEKTGTKLFSSIGISGLGRRALSRPKLHYFDSSQTIIGTSHTYVQHLAIMSVLFAFDFLQTCVAQQCCRLQQSVNFRFAYSVSFGFVVDYNLYNKYNRSKRVELGHYSGRQSHKTSNI